MKHSDKPSSIPIQAVELDEICSFLNKNLNSSIPAADWKASLSHHWAELIPNYGFQLRAGDELVGVMLAIYSDQRIEGKDYRFCNPHSWCVLETYRDHSIDLPLSLLKQKGYQFTMLTPNPDVAKVFRFLKFKDLDTNRLLIPCFPFAPKPSKHLSFTAEGGSIEEVLSVNDRKLFVDHRDLPWIEHAVVHHGNTDDALHIMYKRIRFKKMPSANVLYLSNPELFTKYSSFLGANLLRRQGITTLQVEKRFLSSTPALTFNLENSQAKLYKSSLPPQAIRNAYSELVALDI